MLIFNSEPQGPVYLQGTREVMEEVIEPYEIKQKFWKPAELGGLTSEQLDFVVTTLIDAEQPLVVTGYSGRDTRTVPLLVKLADIFPGM